MASQPELQGGVDKRLDMDLRLGRWRFAIRDDNFGQVVEVVPPVEVVPDENADGVDAEHCPRIGIEQDVGIVELFPQYHLGVGMEAGFCFLFHVALQGILDHLLHQIRVDFLNFHAETDE